MIIYNTFLQYLLSSAAAAVCLVLILVQGREKLKNKTYNATILFTFNILAISLVLCGIYSQEVLFNIYTVSVLIRILDYFFYAFLLFSWCSLLSRLTEECTDTSGFICFKAGKAVSLAGAVLFVCVSLFSMSNTYYIENHSIQHFYTLLEIIFSLTAAAAIVFCVIKAISAVMLSSVRLYIILSSFFISLYFLIQIFMTSGLGITQSPLWNTHCPDFTGWMLFAANLLTVYFIYKKDFQQLYKKNENLSPAGSIEYAIGTVAEEHRLTLREREITEFAYKGYSNAQIAEELCISLYTVKTHIKNIFEKLGVSSRMELTYIINRQFFNITDKTLPKTKQD